MKRLATALFLFFTLVGMGSSAMAQSSVPVGTEARTAPSLPTLKKYPISSALGGKLVPMAGVTHQLAFFDYDSSHNFGTFPLPHGHSQQINGSDYEDYAYCERMSCDALTTAKSKKWYLDSVLIFFAAPAFPADPGNKIVVRALKTQRGGQNNYEYPFGLKFDSSFVTPDQIISPDTIYPYTLKFHHIAIAQPNFFLQVDVGDTTKNMIDVWSDFLNEQSTTPRTIDTTVDRSYWMARHQLDPVDSPQYAGFMSGSYIETMNQFVLYPNFVIVAYVNDPTAGVTRAVGANDFALESVYPNPAGASAEFTYDLGTASDVEIKLYTETGQEVSTIVSGHDVPGRHLAKINASALPNGTYYYAMKAGNFSATQKLVIAK